MSAFYLGETLQAKTTLAEFIKLMNFEFSNGFAEILSNESPATITAFVFLPTYKL